MALVRKARGAALPPSFWSDPLMYQGGITDLDLGRDPDHALDVLQQLVGGGGHGGLGLAALRGRMNNFERSRRVPSLFRSCMVAKGYSPQ